MGLRVEDRNGFFYIRIMSGHSTTYTLTKRVAESLAAGYSQHFPVVIMRPSLVTAAAEDPIPGWLDSHNALTLIVDGIRNGFVRVFYADKDKCLQFVCLDDSIKAFLIATWNVHRKGMQSGVDVYCTSLGGYLGRTRLSWSDMANIGLDLFEDYPAERQMWYPFCFIAQNSLSLNILFFFFQVLPALLGDAIAVAKGLKPKFFNLTIRYYLTMTGSLKQFTSINYHFSIVNYRNLDVILLPKDRETFNLDQCKVNAEEVVRLNLQGMVKYVLNEDLSDGKLKNRKKIYHKFMIVHRAVSVGVLALTCCMTYLMTCRFLSF